MRISSYKSEIPYFILMLALLCLSGNPLFSYESKITAQAFVVVIILLVFAKSSSIIGILKYASFFLSIYLIQSVVIPNFSVTSTGYAVMKMLLGLACANIIGERFTNCYIDVMWVLSVISIVGYALTITIGLLPGIPCGKEGISQVFYTQLYSFELLNRNSGMFWEPGAFAGYLNMALLFMILNERISKVLVIPMLIALATTYSTTGYLVFFILFVYYIRSLKTSNAFIKSILTILAICGIVYAYNNIDFLGTKLSATDDVGNSRITNFATYSKEIADNFLIGASFTENGVSSGNGFLSFLLEVGIIGILFYFISIYNKVVLYFDKKKVLFFIVVIVVSLQGECFLNYPFFMSLPLVNYTNYKYH